jgi:hypothetical protein
LFFAIITDGKNKAIALPANTATGSLPGRTVKRAAKPNVAKL